MSNFDRNRYTMKKIIAFLLFSILLCSSCANDTASSPVTNPVNQPIQTNSEYFRINVGGIQLPLAIRNSSELNSGYMIKDSDDLYHLSAIIGFGFYSDQNHRLEIIFDKNGKIIKAEQVSQDFFGTLEYKNYQNFPSNYFQINVVSLDEANMRIKLTFTGNLYLNSLDFNSEALTISGDLDMKYTMNQGASIGILVNGIEQYCSANFNNVLWKARCENQYSAFTAPDPYKLEIHFASSATIGSYNFNPTSSDNYVKFSKFNTLTLSYDYYNTTGIVSYTYREFHGASKYSFIGTFNFTAVNPNNSSDIIQVTDGKFRSYQQY